MKPTNLDREALQELGKELAAKQECLGTLKYSCINCTDEGDEPAPQYEATELATRESLIPGVNEVCCPVCGGERFYIWAEE
jgi:hypothetical protein